MSRAGSHMNHMLYGAITGFEKCHYNTKYVTGDSVRFRLTTKLSLPFRGSGVNFKDPPRKGEIREN